MKENPYFKFYTGEWITGRIQIQDLDTQGLFINICAHYWHHKGNITVFYIQKRFNNPIGFDLLIDSDIIRLSNEQNIYENKKLIIEFLDEQMADRGVKSVQNTINGKLGGRPKKTQSVILEKPNSKAKKTNIDKIREDNNKIREDKKAVFSKPTQTEVENYFIENGYSKESGTKAFSYYDIADWKDSQGKQVRNWKQKMQSVWFKPENKAVQNAFDWK